MGAHRSQTLRGSQNVPLHHPPWHPACAHVTKAGTVRCSHLGQGSHQVTQRGPSSPPGWCQQVHPHWGAHSSVVAPSPVVQSWLGLRPPSCLWELPDILPTNAFSAQALICNQDHMDQCRKILTTSGFRKCKRRTKIKHQKQLNQRSDGSENET